MESRRLLSAYTLSQIGYFGANANGANPMGTLVADASGNLYGTTSAGGIYGAGTVFEIPAGSSTIVNLAVFNNTDGAVPYGGVTLDSAGNLYGTTRGGGVSGYGTVFEIANGTNTVTTLAQFNYTNGANPYAGVTLDSAGNLYGTTFNGGASGWGTVFEIAAGSNIVTTLASFNFSNGANPYAGVTLDSAGNLYGMTDIGGSSGGSTVYEVAKGSNTVATLASFNHDSAAYADGRVALDSAGNLYGVTDGGGTGSSGMVFEIAKGSNTATTLASFNNINGSNPEGRVTLDSAGNIYGTTDLGGDNGDGTVFELVKDSNTVTTVASFNNTNGANPYGGVMLDSGGNIYGTTDLGGTSGGGTVFEIAKGSNAVTTVASFNGTNGEFPSGGLALDSAGNRYGVSTGAGASGDGTVFEISKGSNTVTTLASFNGSNGMKPAGGVTLDSSGNLYGTTMVGGPSYDGTVFEIAKGSNTVTTLASFSNGAYPSGGVTLDSGGNLYGTIYGGGASGDGTIFEVARGSNTVTTLASFNRNTNGSTPRAGVTLDSDGNMYGTTTQGGASGYGTVFELAKGSNMVTALASFNYSTGYSDAGVTLDSGGNLFGTTFQGGASNYGTVFEIAKGSNTVATLASFNRANGNYPHAVTLDSAGNLYGTTEGGGERYAGTVFEIVKGSNSVTTLASFNYINGASPDGSVTLDSAGNIYGTTQQNYGTFFELSPQDTITATAGADNVTLAQDADGQHIDWTVNGGASGQLPISDPNGLTINGDGGDDIINVTNGNALPDVLHLNGTFTINGLQGSSPLVNTTLEIGRSTVYISYASPASDPIAGITQYLHNGYNNGAWNGAATALTGVITSVPAANNAAQTTGIGYADSADGLIPGQPVNTIELRYTLYGDTTLTGSVGFNDFTRFTQHYNQTSGATWDAGDFNYDGSVNFDDFTLMTRTYNTSLGSQAIPAISAAKPIGAAVRPAGSSSALTLKPPVVEVNPAPTPPRRGLSQHHKKHRR